MALTILSVAAVPTAFTQCPAGACTQAVFPVGGFDLALSATPGSAFIHFGAGSNIPITIPGLTNANLLYIRAPGAVSFYVA